MQLTIQLEGNLTLNAYIRKDNFKSLTSYLRRQQKKKIKCKENRMKEIINISIEISEMEKRKNQQRKSMTMKAGSLEKSKKLIIFY